jgi:hypothetical protein
MTEEQLKERIYDLFDSSELGNRNREKLYNIFIDYRKEILDAVDILLEYKIKQL